MSSRVNKSIRNIVFGLSNQIIIMFLGFVSRVVFLRFLNENYLGINSLFSELLSMLSLADLGMTTVMIFSFYDPLAKKDENKIVSLLTFYQKAYRIIAVVVAAIGIVLIPFLHLIVNLDSEIDNLYGYYLLFLTRTVLSYLFVYKVSILNADQNNYIVTRISIRIKIGTVIAQIIVLYLTHNYLFYLIIDVVSVWLFNYWCAKKADNMYPFIRNKALLPSEEKKIIIQNIKSGFIYKLSSVLLNSTDNIIISILLGTAMVGYYSNYGLVIGKLSIVINIVFASLSASVGNLIATEKSQKRYQVFSIMGMISFFLASISSICIFIMMNSFIILWIGDTYILGIDVLIACMLNFYLSIVLQPLWVYRDATGLYRKTKHVMLYTAGINIVLSIILGQRMGLSGIIFASVVSRLATYFWYEPRLLFKEYFNKKSAVFFRKQLYNFIIMLLILWIDYITIDKMVCTTWIQFVLKSVALLVQTIVLFVIAYFWRSDFKESIEFVMEKARSMHESKHSDVNS